VSNWLSVGWLSEGSAVVGACRSLALLGMTIYLVNASTVKITQSNFRNPARHRRVIAIIFFAELLS
jgi:hypothetical protein